MTALESENLFLQKKEYKMSPKKKESSVFKKSRARGFMKVHISYLLEELDWIRANTTLSSGNVKNSPSVMMVDDLLTWAGLRRKPIWMFFVNNRDYKQWIELREDHWLLDHSQRAELVKNKMI